MILQGRRLRRSPWLGVGVALLAASAWPARPAGAACQDTVLVRPATRYSTTIVDGAGTTTTHSCTLAVTPSRRYLIEVLRPVGGPTGSAIRVVYDGTEYFGTQDMGAPGVLVSRIITPDAIANLQVTVWGSIGFGVDLRITQVPEPMYGVFGPSTIIRNSSQPVWQSRSFSFPDGVPAGPAKLLIVNGNPDGSLRTLDTEVEFNGTKIVNIGEITLGKARLTRDVTLQPSNTIRAKIYSPNGTRVAVSVQATDTSAAALTVHAPAESTVTNKAKVATSGTVVEPETGVLLQHGATMIPVNAGVFADSLSVPPPDGVHALSLVVTNGACQSTTVSRKVIRDTRAPTLVVTSPAGDTQVSAATFLVVGTWVDSTRTRIRVDGDSAAHAWSGPTPQIFQLSIPLDYGSNGIVIDATDAAGNKTQIKRYVFRTPPGGAGADSMINAPPVAAGESSEFRSRVQFIYDGTSGFQEGLQFASLIPGREAVITGRVLSRDHVGLGAIRVRVLGHAEFGYADTRSDGRFDMVVNGGATYTLRLLRDGYLETQRKVEVPLQDFAVLDSVALVGRSTRVYSVNTASDMMAVGKLEADANGDRRLAMFFQAGTVCSVTTSPGAVQTFTQFHVRVKEFTVGVNGDVAMPAELPPSSAYTYCVDMSVDEAGDPGTSESMPPIVKFSKPITTYMREILGFPVGTAIPSAHYDRQQGRWVGSEDGCIVRFLDAGNGLANLDTNGDGVADAQSRYDSLGITNAERAALVGLYAAGDTLNRVRTDHFSPRDHNFNNGAMLAADSPSAAEAAQLGGLTICPTATRGCIIENENRVLGETIPIVGTRHALHYRSNRQPGDLAMRMIRIPITGQTALPSSIQRVILRVDVAGRRFQHVVTNPPLTPLGPNQYRDFGSHFGPWDGIDVHGRKVVGSAMATVWIGYQYRVMMSARPGAGSSFGDASRMGTTSGRVATGDRDIGTVIWNKQEVALGAPGAYSAGLGGWTITPHHLYDLNGRGAVYRGDGSVVLGNRLYPIAQRFAGNGGCTLQHPGPWPTD